MKLISHRGNLIGAKTCLENHPDSIKHALEKGFDCEIDVWKKQNKFYLGHDFAQYQIDREFLLQDKLWIHCKNLQALVDLKSEANVFFHNIDSYTLTSKGYVWAYPGSEVIEDCVRVQFGVQDIPENIYGICSDCVEEYAKLIN